MKYTCDECEKDFIDEVKKGCGVVIGIICPYCKAPVNVEVGIYEEKED